MVSVPQSNVVYHLKLKCLHIQNLTINTWLKCSSLTLRYILRHNCAANYMYVVLR